MEFESEEKTILGKPAYVFIGVLILVGVLIAVLLQIIYHNNPVQTEEKVLTAKEIQEERLSLANNNPDLIINENTFQDDSTEDTSPPKTNSKSPTLVLENNSQLKKTVTSPQPSSDTGVESIESFSSNEHPDVKISVELPSTDDVQMNIEGTIFGINAAENEITIVQTGGAGLFTVNVDANTKYILNDGIISFSDIKDSDRIVVEGYGKETGSSMLATKITVIGFIQIPR